MKWLLMFTMTLLASVLPMILPAQTADYNKVIVQAKADLAAGHNAEALAGSLKAIQMDASRWEAYLVAGSALQTQKQFDAAMDNYSKALERAPESKKVGVRNVLEQCMREKISATSSPSASVPAATTQGPTFKETLEWVISQNVREGYKFHHILTFNYKDGTSSIDDQGVSAYHIYFTHVDGNRECAAANFQPTDEAGNELPPDHVHVSKTQGWIDFTALAPASIGVKQFVFHSTTEEWEAEGSKPAYTLVNKLIPDPIVVYEITGLYGKMSDGGPGYANQDLANRVAKALNHAIDVCGGKGKPEAF